MASIFPVGKGHDIEVHEFDFRDNGGVIYNKNGVRIIHWQRSHAKDGASGYRLDWNGLSFVWTGDGRPSDLDIKYAKGVDVYVTEAQTELCEISSGVQGAQPFLARYTVDTHHTPAYAAGYLANQIQPRLFMTTHMPFDPYLNEDPHALPGAVPLRGPRRSRRQRDQGQDLGAGRHPPQVPQLTGAPIRLLQGTTHRSASDYFAG